MKDPTDTRDIGPRVGSPLWIHLTLVTVAGAVVFGLAVSQLSGMSHLIDRPLFWVLVAMVVLGDLWPIVTPGRSSMEAPLASVTFCFGALIAWGLPLAVLLRGTSAIVTLLARRKAPHRAAFNAAASTLGMAAGGATLYALCGQLALPNHAWIPHNDDIWRILLAGAA